MIETEAYAAVMEERVNGGAAKRRPLLVAENLSKAFPVSRRLVRRNRDAVHAVDRVSLTIHDGEAVGVVGETGSGKSTFARLILRLIEADGGRVLFDGTDVFGVSGERLKAMRRAMQIVFQDPIGALDPRMRLGTSLVAPLQQHGIATRAERLHRAAAMVERVGLDVTFLHRYPDECSGGELQRVVIARALLLEPRLLVCDEPTASLDASSRAQILNLLGDLRREFGLSLLLISHDLRVVNYMCDRIAVMYLGRIVEDAPAAALFGDPLHPYTRKLMEAALLERETLVSDEVLIEGEPPSPIDPPPGCHFHPRCPYAREDCSHAEPLLAAARPGHDVACFYWDRLASGRATGG